MDNDELTPEAVCAGLITTALPRRVLYYPQIDSTMNLARTLLPTLTDDETPLLALTDEQTAGRGRSGRPWVTPPGSALLFSLAFRPTWLTPADAPTLTWMGCVALCEGIAMATGLQPRLKWPNDLMLELPDQTPADPAAPLPSAWRKTAGVLVELSSTEQAIVWAIIGCGLNVSASPPDSLPLRYPATHLSAAVGGPVPRLPLLRALLTRLDYWYVRLRDGGRDQLFDAWRSLLMTLGREVEVTTASGTLSGLAEDVEPSGALLLRDAAGNLHSIASGDLR